MRITRRLEFDAGHRIPQHRSRCRHLHGHRYAIEITLVGELIAGRDAPERGMVMDFSEVRDIAWRELVDGWDHAFLAWRGDTEVVEFLRTLPQHKTVLFDEPPTAEHLAQVAFRVLAPAYRGRYPNGPRLERVRIYETPNCWADAIEQEG
jgi:6-pyruvoyltetrahydropterin/6-carboxytetrahydropterin synthase